MKTTIFLLVALVAGPLAAGDPRPADTSATVGAAGAADALSVAISIPRRGKGERRVDLRNADSHFHVIVTNTSQSEQRLWETWNTWGYYNLRFEVLNEKGAVEYTIAKNNDRIWTVNYPSRIALEPGDSFVLDVHFDAENWKVPFLATPDAQGQFKLKMRAVFENKADDETAKQGVWTGKLESKADDYTIAVSRKSKSPPAEP